MYREYNYINMQNFKAQKEHGIVIIENSWKYKDLLVLHHWSKSNKQYYLSGVYYLRLRQIHLLFLNNPCTKFGLHYDKISE